MRKVLQLSCVLALAGLSFGCSTRNVVVAPADVAMAGYQTHEGLVNSAGFELGELVVLDSSTGRGYVALSASVGAYDVAAPKPRPDSAEPFTAPFELSYTDWVPSPVKAQAQAKVRDQATLHVQSPSQFGLRAPALFAFSHPELAGKMAEIKAANPQATFFLVSQLTGARQVYLTCDAPNGTVKVGKYQFHVYLKRENLQLAGMFPHSQFYSLTPLTLAKANDGRTVAVVSQETPGNLPNYQFTGENLASAE
ncbi:MAG TPA: hypothetical protein VFC78_08725 [Tepidisphaeraceae bacterium]|nr:hypothetical protein [Tepidisphaeraceae bacterium]